jgi:hypothetical protein
MVVAMVVNVAPGSFGQHLAKNKRNNEYSTMFLNVFYAYRTPVSNLEY